MQSIKHPDYINLPKAARGRRSRNAFPPFKMIVSFFGLTCLLWPTAISAFSSSGNTADSCTPPPPPFKVTRRAIAGLWRLTPQPTYPLKEFTVHPKKKKLQQRLSAKGWTRDQHKKELLLILNEDGSFQQYMESLSSASDEEDDEKVDLNDQWSQFQQSQQLQQKNIDDIDDDNDDDDDTSSLSLLSNHLAKGVWDYVDGKLILAADRPSATNAKDDHQPKGGPSLGSSSKVGKHSVVASSGQSRLDKLIVGRVVASTLSSTQTRQQQRQPNPQLPPPSAELSDSSKDTMQADKQTGDDDNTLTSTTPSSNQQPDTSSSSTLSSSFNTNLLSVPKGSLKMGKFFYPKNHPSFFDQPIYNPTTAVGKVLHLTPRTLHPAHGESQLNRPSTSGPLATTLANGWRAPAEVRR
ncbi:hypothetical protein ACA910_001199 [Epithemia clementina (nom. ined.)]